MPGPLAFRKHRQRRLPSGSGDLVLIEKTAHNLAAARGKATVRRFDECHRQASGVCYRQPSVGSEHSHDRRPTIGLQGRIGNRSNRGSACCHRNTGHWVDQM